jgi:chitinase
MQAQGAQAPTGGTSPSPGGPDPGGIGIIGEDPPLVSFSKSEFHAGETSGQAYLSVVLSHTAESPVTAQFSTSDGTARAGVDYRPVAGQTVTFRPGQTAQTVTVGILDDGEGTPEGHEETVGLHLDNAVGAQVGLGSATLAIDEAGWIGPPVRPPVVEFARLNYDVDENAGYATIVVVLTKGQSTPATVHYATADGTATSPADYQATEGTLTFQPGQTEQDFQVPISDDSREGGTRQLGLSLDSPEGIGLGSPSRATLTIHGVPAVSFTQFSYQAQQAEGGLAQITVALDEPATQPVTVQVSTGGGTAQPGVDYDPLRGYTVTFQPGQSSQTFGIRLHDDGEGAGDETVDLALGNPQHARLGLLDTAVLTIHDLPRPEVEFAQADYGVDEGGRATVYMQLSRPVNRQVTVHYRTADGTAASPEDYAEVAGTLTFPPYATQESFAVSTVEDGEIEQQDDTVLLSLDSPVYATLGGQGTATLTIHDVPPPVVEFAQADYLVGEGGTASVTVALSQPLNHQVSVHYATADGTATSPEDYQAAQGWLTFQPGQTVLSFTIATHEDGEDAQQADTVLLSLDSPQGAFLGSTDTATLTILEVPPPSVEFLQGGYEVPEVEGDTAIINVQLSQAVNSPVSVHYATADGTARSPKDYDATAGTLTFQPFQTSQSI